MKPLGHELLFFYPNTNFSPGEGPEDLTPWVFHLGFMQ
jgi:hypothetical protein